MTRDTTSQNFFEDKYRADPDPWHFASSDYEQQRYNTTCNAINHRRYRRAFEPGCAVGELTARLATICDHVEAIEISPSAVEQARERCHALPNVRILCEKLPGFIPAGTFDLIVLSEIGYYFDETQLEEIGKQLVSILGTPGTLVSTHWLGTSEDHVLSGDRVHEILASLDGLTHAHSERHPGYRLDVWNRA